jgi:hypothetical protein
MTDDSITITGGAPQMDVAPGTYEATLLSISDPRTIFPQSGPNAGKEVQLRDWVFALEDGTEINGSASVASGPKSKSFAWLTALLGGTPPVIGQSYPKSQLIGREALITIAIDEGGWPKITNLSARPKARSAPVSAPIAAPVAVAPVAAPARRAQPVAAVAAPDLPF